jgi:hypothetical protein
MDESQMVSGAMMSQNQCIGMYTLIGGAAGGVGGAFLGAGSGAPPALGLASQSAAPLA